MKSVRFKYISAKYKNGWYWCKSKGSKLEWYWEPIRNITNEFYVMYTLLQTDKRGRAGLASDKIKATIIVEYLDRNCPRLRWGPASGRNKLTPSITCPKKIKTIKVISSYLKMENPFRPIDITKDESRYLALGYVRFYVPPSLIKSVRSFGFKISIEWPPQNDSYFFAGSSDYPPILIFKR